MFATLAYTRLTLTHLDKPKLLPKACRSAFLLHLLTAIALTGCSIGSRDIESPTAYLTASGWQNNRQFLQEDSFADYANAITDEVQRYRIPFDPERADAEVALASPTELPLGAHCVGIARGIAILVHGLADTAFSLKDIGTVLADACYKSRLVLLPGHGTKSGDLLTTRLSDWQDTIHYLIDQAAAETEHILLAGFSLGAVLTLDAALQRQDVIDGIIGLSPAYYLSSARIAKWAPVAAPLMKWVDRGVADDAMRYEAMPTRGVAETWKSIQQVHRSLKKNGPLQIPWMLAQSMDDAVVVPEQNETLWKKQAVNPHSRLIRFVTDTLYPTDPNTLNLPGNSNADRVIALTHLAIHQSPDNPHYGINGQYRNCGGGMPREGNQVELCEQSEVVWYGLWSTEPEPGRAMAYSTFNPSFDAFAEEIKRFAAQIAGEKLDE